MKNSARGSLLVPSPNKGGFQTLNKGKVALGSQRKTLFGPINMNPRNDIDIPTKLKEIFYKTTIRTSILQARGVTRQKMVRIRFPQIGMCIGGDCWIRSCFTRLSIQVENHINEVGLYWKYPFGPRLNAFTIVYRRQAVLMCNIVYPILSEKISFDVKKRTQQILHSV